MVQLQETGPRASVTGLGKKKTGGLVLGSNTLCLSTARTTTPYTDLYEKLQLHDQCGSMDLCKQWEPADLNWTQHTWSNLHHVPLVILHPHKCAN